MPLQHRLRLGIGLLQVDAPVLQLIERDAHVSDGAADIGSRRDHAEVAVEILHLRFTAARGAELVQQDCVLRIAAGCSMSARSTYFRKAIYHKYVVVSAPANPPICDGFEAIAHASLLGMDRCPAPSRSRQASCAFCQRPSY